MPAKTNDGKSAFCNCVRLIDSIISVSFFSFMSVYLFRISPLLIFSRLVSYDTSMRWQTKHRFAYGIAYQNRVILVSILGNMFIMNIPINTLVQGFVSSASRSICITRFPFYPSKSTHKFVNNVMLSAYAFKSAMAFGKASFTPAEQWKWREKREHNATERMASQWLLHDLQLNGIIVFYKMQNPFKWLSMSICSRRI